MIAGYSPLTQAFLGTMFTWGVTAAGSATVFFFNGYKRSFLDASLGFASGVMTAASFWSLLLPALEISEQLNNQSKMLSVIPVVIGFLLGAFFVYITDLMLPDNYMENILLGESDSIDCLSVNNNTDNNYDVNKLERNDPSNIRLRQVNPSQTNNENLIKTYYDFDDKAYKNKSETNDLESSNKIIDNNKKQNPILNSRFRRIILLIIAVTVHNIPEGLAVGVGFGAVGMTKSATFQNARNLAIGIGIQNFPEGLAVSLPLYASGFSYWKSFWYGQLSGMVEPIAGLIGVLTVGFAQVCLPYALSFAAGAMIYVVFDNLIPEATSHGNSKLATWFCMLGFCIMMSLDVGLS